MNTKERIKTLLLLVLLFGAIFLTYSIWFYDNPMENNFLLGIFQNNEDEYNDKTLTELMLEENATEIIPFTISYKNEKGRFGAMYHAESVHRLYQKTIPILREALSTVSAIESCSEKDWVEALSDKGIFYDFEGIVPLAALAIQVGSENVNRFTIFGRYLIFLEDYFYFKNPDTKEYIRLQHELDSTELQNVISEMSAAKCSFAVEVQNTQVAAETLLFEENISAFAINGYNPISFFSEEQMIALLKIFNMNYNICGRYTEQDGTQVYIQDLDVLKVAPDGYITYSNEHGDDDAQGGIVISSIGDVPELSDVLQATSGLIARLRYFAGGNGIPYMQNITKQNQKDSWKIHFGWSFGGIPVDRQKTGYCAEIIVSGKRITKIEFYARSYESAGNIVSVMPQKIAVAIVDPGTHGAIALRYTDGGGSGLVPQWYLKMK